MNHSRPDPLVVRVCLTILHLARHLVPRTARDRWIREWEAEIRHRWQMIYRGTDPRWHRQADLVKQSSGAVADAAYLRRQFTADLDLVQDARYAIRMLRKRPVLSTLAVAVLALGLAGTITVFSTIDTLLLRELPYANADRIVTVWQTEVTRTDERLGVAPGAFVDWRERTRSFATFAAAEPFALDYLEGPEPVSLIAGLVTQGFFESLGVQPVRGRLFLPEEYREGRSDVVMLSYSAWQRRFGADERVVGRTIRFEGRPFLVTGILPATFHPDVLRRANEQEVWSPQIVQPFELENRRGRYWSAVGRLAPGVSLEQAQAELATISRQLAREYPRTMSSMTATVVPLRQHIARPLREPLALLFTAVVMVLLIACANIASLLIARSAERQREFAVRAAIGAGRWRLVRQMLVEAAVLTVLACGLGVAIAYLAMRTFVGFTARLVPQLADVTLDTRLMLFSIALTAATSLLIGLWPAIQMSRGRVHDGLKETAGGLTSSTRRRRLASALVVGEVALALVLLTGAGLLVRSFVTLSGVDPGFVRSNIAVLQVFAYGDRYPTDAHRLAFFDQTLDRFRNQPGVVRAGLVSSMPFMATDIDTRGGYRIEGRPAPPDAELPATSIAVATADFFEALRIPLRTGRLFSDVDRDTAPPVAVINDLLAARAWPGGDAVGKRITVNLQGRWRTMEVVGVVGQVRRKALENDARPELYVPHAQVPSGSMTFVVQTSVDPAAVLPTLKARVWEIDPTLPLYDTATLDSLVSQSLAPRRFVMQIVGSLSGLAFVLAAIGIYGMLSFSTAQRTREIGVRIAMGGSRGSIMGMVIREGMALVIAGVVVGLATTVVLTRAMTALLYGVSPTDPATLVGTAALLLVVALIACYVPARRATKVDPLGALRAQ
ncbi:MAG TPA: ABC transporter permease [Vicinamibacterales bacterium]|nr:ABC transporter permease [Vicinamibacterales bacterium]